MTSFLPSEIARLVLGYLKAEGCTKSYKTFLNESAYLAEYRTLLQQGREFPTSIVGKGLIDMLEEYGQLKIQDGNSTSDVWGKFDKVVNQLRNVARHGNLGKGPKPQDIATFQKRRGCYNAKKNSKVRVLLDTQEEQESFSCNASVISDAPSSPRSHPDDDSLNTSLDKQPNSSSETQRSGSILQQSSHSSGGSVHNSVIVDNNLSTSTPGRTLGERPSISHSFPFQSPIVVSDSDNPFSPDSYPGTPGVHINLHQSTSLLKDVTSSPNSNKTLAVTSPVVTIIASKPVFTSPKIIKNKSTINCHTVLSNNRVDERQQQIKAMRTGVLSALTKTNLEKARLGTVVTLKSVDMSTFKNLVPSPDLNMIKGMKTIDKSKVKKTGQTLKCKKPTINDSVNENVQQNEVDDTEMSMCDIEDTLLIASPVKTPEKEIHTTSTRSRLSALTSSLFSPARDSNSADNVILVNDTMHLETPLKTPVKRFLEGECSRDGFRSPKRKSQAPKRRSFDPAKDGPLVTPVKNNPSFLSMPMLDDLVKNTRFAEKLADSINQFITNPDGEDNSCSKKEVLMEETTSINVSEIKKNRRSRSPADKLNCSPNKKSSFTSIRKSVSPVQTKSLVSSPPHIDLTVDGNDSTGSVKPPLSCEELNSILEDTHMSEGTIQGIINMTQTDPEFDALFNLFNVDKEQFIEKEYGVSLKDYNRITPSKISLSSTSQKESSQGSDGTCYKVQQHQGIVCSSDSVSTLTAVTPASSMPTIHVQTVDNKTPTSITDRKPVDSTSSGGFLQLLHDSNNTHPSYVETVQLVTAKNDSSEPDIPHNESVGFELVHTTCTADPNTSTTINVNKVSDNVKEVVQESADSNSSEDAVLELPNGIKLSVLPAGTDLNSQMQTLDTLTQLQKLLSNGYTLTPAGPVVSSVNMGSASVITPVKLVSKPAVTSVSPGTSAMIQAVNTQQLQITHSSLDTVDMSGLNLVTGPTENNPASMQNHIDAESTSCPPKKRRGRPKKIVNERNQKIDIANDNSQKESLAKQNKYILEVKNSSPVQKADVGGRLGMRDSRSNTRKNLRIPSTSNLSTCVGGQTQSPTVTFFDGNNIRLLPANTLKDLLQREGNQCTEKNEIANSSDKTNVLQTLLQTSMASSILGPCTINNLSQQTVNNNSIQSSAGVAITPNAQSIFSGNSLIASPSPRRKLFELGESKSKNPIISSNKKVISNVDIIASTEFPVQTAASIMSMGSMLWSPTGKNKTLTSKIKDQDLMNVICDSKHGIYKISNSTLSENFNSNTKTSVTIVSRSDIKRNQNRSGVFSIPANFTCLLDPSKNPRLDNKEEILKTGDFQQNSSEARRVVLTTLKHSEGEESNSFQSSFPNFVSNSSLIAQPGNVEEMTSPSNVNVNSDFHDEGTCMSIVSAMQSIDASIDVETAKTLIKFATKAVVTPKKLDLDNVDENSNLSSTVVDVSESIVTLNEIEHNQNEVISSYPENGLTGKIAYKKSGTCYSTPDNDDTKECEEIQAKFAIFNEAKNKSFAKNVNKDKTNSLGININEQKNILEEHFHLDSNMPDSNIVILNSDNSVSFETAKDGVEKLQDDFPQKGTEIFKSSKVRTKKSKQTKHIKDLEILESPIKQQGAKLYDLVDGSLDNRLGKLNSRTPSEVSKSNNTYVSDLSLMSDLPEFAKIKTKKKLILKKCADNVVTISDNDLSTKMISRDKSIKKMKKGNENNTTSNSDFNWNEANTSSSVKISEVKTCSSAPIVKSYENAKSKELEIADVVGYNSGNNFKDLSKTFKINSSTSLHTSQNHKTSGKIKFVSIKAGGDFLQIEKTPEKQSIPTKLIRGTSPYRSIPLAKLAELGARELKTLSSPRTGVMSLFSPLRTPKLENCFTSDASEHVNNKSRSPNFVTRPKKKKVPTATLR